jgi:hypothetical protein
MIEILMARLFPTTEIPAVQHLKALVTFDEIKIASQYDDGPLHFSVDWQEFQ